LIFLRREHQNPNLIKSRNNSIRQVSVNWRRSSPLINFIWRNIKIVTEEFEELFKNYPLYSQEQVKDPLVIVTRHLTSFRQVRNTIQDFIAVHKLFVSDILKG